MRVPKEFSNYNLDFGMQNGVESGGDLFVRSDVGKGRYRFFNMSKDHNYLDDLTNRTILQKIAQKCYLPMNALLLDQIQAHSCKLYTQPYRFKLAVEE